MKKMKPGRPTLSKKQSYHISIDERRMVLSAVKVHHQKHHLNAKNSVPYRSHEQHDGGAQVCVLTEIDLQASDQKSSKEEPESGKRPVTSWRFGHLVTEKWRC